MPPVTPAQRRATDKYIKDKTDELKIRIPKGRKAEYQTHAESRGESLNGFVNRAIDNQVKQDKAVSAFTVQPSEDEQAKGTKESE